VLGFFGAAMLQRKIQIPSNQSFVKPVSVLTDSFDLGTLFG
jgi:hypothetical protein